MPMPKVDLQVFLANIRKGRFVQHVNEQLEELNRAMFAHDGDGELTLTFKFKNKGDGQVVVTPRCKVKKPTGGENVGEGIFYLTVDGDLEREDPKQGALDLKVHKLGERDDN